MTNAARHHDENETVVARPLGRLEHWFWRMNQHRSIHFVMAAEIAGRRSATHWRRALDAVQARHPLLGACIRAEEGAAPHFHQVPTARISLTVEPWQSSEQWIDVLTHELSTPFDAAFAPLVRARLLEDDDRAMLLLAMHHAIADGMSATFIVRDLLKALNEESLTLRPMPRALEDRLPPPEPVPPAPPGAPADAAPMPPALTYRPLNGIPPRTEALAFTVEETSSLVARARAEQTTVHAALATALVMAGRDLSAGWRKDVVRVFTPINIRAHLKVDDDCVLSLSAGATPFAPDEAPAFWDHVRAVKGSVSMAQSPLGVQLTLAAIGSSVVGNPGPEAVSQFTAQALGYELMVTNLCRPAIDTTFGDLRLQALWGPAILVGFVSEQSVGAGTVNGSLRLLHTSHQPIAGLLEATRRRLLESCRTG